MLKNLFNQKGISGMLLGIIIAGILILAGGGYYMISQRATTPSSRSDSSTAPQTTTDSTPEESVDNVSSTIEDVVGKGQNLECDWKLPTEEGAPNPFGTGKLYTTGNKGRSMISGNSSGMAIDGNAIYKDNEVYSWISVAGTTMGFKFDKAELESMESSMTAEEKQQAEQIRAKMIFQCKPWTPDESKFVLPTGVEFK